MSGLSKLPPLIPETFRWEKSKTDPRVQQRRGNGTEAWVGIKDENGKGQYDLYLITSLRISDAPATPALSLSILKEKFQAVLLNLRFKHPDIACTAVWDNPVDSPIIQYTPPENNEDALKWAEDIIQILATPKDGLAVRTEIEEQRRSDRKKFGGKSAKSLSIYTIADVANENILLTPGTVVDVLFHMNHMHWDGISARMFAGELLQGLAQSFSPQQKSQYDWGQEIANLSVPILDALSIDVGALGDEFNTTREEFITSLMNSGSSWGIKLKVEEGAPSTVFYNFTALESAAIISAVKSRVGPEYTISHLGQAATLLALLKINPPSNDTPDSQSAIMALPMNGRRWLREEFVSTQYGSCQAGAVVEFENIKSFIVNDDKDAIIEALERGCRLTKQSYDKWLSKPFQLALGISKDNFLAQYLATNPSKYGGSSVPVFITDGINDRYIPGDVINAGTGEKIMSVENVAFFLDTHLPDILVRLDSWKGASAFSLCFNSGNISAEEASAFLKSIASYMLAFI